jgi:hypothetical protein
MKTAEIKEYKVARVLIDNPGGSTLIKVEPLVINLSYRRRLRVHRVRRDDL